MIKHGLSKLISGCSIAVVSSSSVQAGIVKSLIDTFCNVMTAFSVDELEQLLEQYQFDLVICDRRLSDGTKAEEVIKILPKSTIKIIATSDEEIDWEDPKYPDFVLPKPFDKEFLADIVLQFLNLKKEAYKRRNKILIVDDSPTSRAQLRSIFQSISDAEVLEAKTGMEAIEKIESSEAELKFVTMDLYLPDMDGLEVTQRIRKKGIYIPIFMITSEIDPKFVEEAFEKGITFYMPKSDITSGKAHLMEKLVNFVRATQTQLPILLIEDSSFMRSLLATQLHIQGYPVVSVSSAEEGLKIVKLNKILLTITNLNLTGKSGIDFVRELQKLKKPGYEKIVMVYTSSVNPLVTFEAFYSGASDFLKAPFNMCDFYIRVYNLIRLRETLYQLELSRKKMYDLSVQDELTGLYNRRYFIENLKNAVERAKRTGESLTVMMIDLNHFKQINDVYGHHVGDAVLKTFSKILRETLRKADVVARYGGDEFTVLLSGSKGEACREVANRLRERASAVKFKEHPDVKISISVGCAELKEVKDHTNPIDAILKLADNRMYEDKKRQKASR